MLLSRLLRGGFWGALIIGAGACSLNDEEVVRLAEPPDTVLLQQPERLTRSTQATFEFESTTGTTFHCVLDDKAMANCSSPLTLTVSDGGHSFMVWAINADKIPDKTPVMWQWTVDTTPPTVSILTSPPPYDNTTSPTFTFSAEHQSLITCSLDNGPREVCSSPYQVGPLSDGAHTLSLLATDVAGNVQPEAATYSWTLDTTTPDVTLLQTPPALGNQREVTFTFETSQSTTPLSLRCLLNGIERFPCASPMVFSVSDWTHRFEVRAYNALGIPDPTPAVFEFTVDSQAPPLALTAKPAFSTGNDLSFWFSSSEGSLGFQCALSVGADEPSFAPCTPPFVAQDVPEGPVTFTVRLTDLAGNTTTRTTTTTVDTVAPTLTLTESPAARSADATPTFAFQVQGASVVECRIDYSPYAPCSSPWTLALGSGNHLHEIRARDAAGNTTTVSTSFVIDLWAPVITFTAAPAANTAVTSTTFAFTVQDSDLQTVECSYDAAPYAPCTSPVTISSLTLGNHSFSVRATDGLGNTGLRTHFFHADPRPINITFLSGPLGDTADNSPFFTWSQTFATSRMCRYDANPMVSDCGSVLGTTLPDGPHTFYVRIWNDRGESLVATRSFTVDTVAPTVTITGGPTGTITTPSVEFSFVAGADAVTTECRLFRQGAATGSYAPCASPYPLTLSPPSTPYPYVFEVRVADQAGNQWSTYRSFTYTTP